MLGVQAPSPKLGLPPDMPAPPDCFLWLPLEAPGWLTNVFSLWLQPSCFGSLTAGLTRGAGSGQKTASRRRFLAFPHPATQDLLTAPPHNLFCAGGEGVGSYDGVTAQDPRVSGSRLLPPPPPPSPQETQGAGPEEKQEHFRNCLSGDPYTRHPRQGSRSKYSKS